MKQFLFTIAILSFTIVCFPAQGQTNQQKATRYGIMPKPIYVPSIAQQIKDGTFKAAGQNDEIRKGMPKHRGANKTIPGKGFPKGNDALVATQKQAHLTKGKEPSLVFNANISNYTPSDPNGAVGPNHYMASWNTSFRIFDKSGNPLTENALLSTIFPGNNLGDPVVIYDAEADRFILTEFDNNPNGFNMAVCQGPDPVNDGWYVYTTGFETGTFPDYTKFSIWSDGYYVTANINATEKVFAVERDSMLVGAAAQFVGFPLTGITTSGFYSPQFFHVTDDNLPPAGDATVVYLQDDAWSGVSSDHIKMWTVDVNWADVQNSTISNPTELATTPFISVFDGGSFSNIPQPSGPDQDALQATIMQQAQYRRFSDHNSAVFNFVVDTDGSSDEQAGIRWFELRQNSDGDPWYIYQEGTYITPNGTKGVFSGSMVMDIQGNIGMAYTSCSETDSISIFYTGRYASDPLNQMTVDETLIAKSNSNNPSNRLADYVHLTCDPVNGKTMWHIAEYFNNNQRTDVVGVFQLASDYQDDAGIVGIPQPENGQLTDSENITVTIKNFGENDQTDIPVSYRIDGASAINETYIGTILSGETADYTFSATADMSIEGHIYHVESWTGLLADEYNGNDSTWKDVMHLYADDIGVTDITAPLSGSGLSDAEPVSIVIRNFGYAEQSNFDVSYLLDGNSVTEQVAGPLAMDSSISYTFAQTADLMDFGTYDFSSYTSLPADADNTNDTAYSSVTNMMCQPDANCNEGDGFYYFHLRDLENTTDCSESGYGDYTDMIAELETQETYPLTVTTHYGSQNIKLWIDFNDNFVFEADEVLIDNYVIANGQGGGVFTEDIPVSIPQDANLGEHMMRAKSNWNNPVPDDACEGTEYGETEDYKANIILYTGMEDIPLSKTDMIIKSLGNNQFEISLSSNDVSEDLKINIHNIMGQKLVENWVKNINGRYVYQLDMSFAETGAYIIRLGNSQYGKVSRIIVK
jgi:hypothetical protein